MSRAQTIDYVLVRNQDKKIVRNAMIFFPNEEFASKHKLLVLMMDL